MKNSIALFSALAVLGLAAPKAEALFIDFGGLIKKAESLVNKFTGGLLDKAQAVGKQVIGHAGSWMNGMVGKLAQMGRDAAGKAREALFRTAQSLVSKLPGFLKPLGGQLVKTGNTLLGGLLGGMHGLIDQAAQVGRSWITKATKGAVTRLGGVADFLKGRVTQLVDQGRKIATGALTRITGQVQGIWNKGVGRAQGIVKGLMAKLGKGLKVPRI